MKKGRGRKFKRSKARRKIRLPRRKVRAKKRARFLGRKIRGRAKRLFRRAKRIKRAARLVKRRATLRIKKRKVRARRATAPLKDKYVKDLLMEVAGEKALKIAKGLGNPVTDEQLADFCKIKISDVRAVLNKLHSYGLATYERTRDKESGWYSYIWNLTLDNAPKMLEERKRGEAVKIEGEAAYAGAEFYTCEKHGELRIPFEIAFENKFRCLECGSPLNFVEKAPSVAKEAQKK